MKISKQTVLYVVLGISLAVNAYVIGAIGYYSYKIKSIGIDTTWIENALIAVRKNSCHILRATTKPWHAK